MDRVCFVTTSTLSFSVVILSLNILSDGHGARKYVRSAAFEKPNGSFSRIDSLLRDLFSPE